MFEFQSVRRSFPRNLAENSEAASFFCQTTSFETEVQEREPWFYSTQVPVVESTTVQRKYANTYHIQK
jgi:hypothetical protein